MTDDTKRKAALQQAREQVLPIREAWDELNEAFRDMVVQVVALETGTQSAAARAVQAVAECATRLREIEADLKRERGFGLDDDDDEAV